MMFVLIIGDYLETARAIVSRVGVFAVGDGGGDVGGDVVFGTYLCDVDLIVVCVFVWINLE